MSTVLVSLLPAVFFGFKVYEYFPGQWPEIFWFCTVSNLVLSVGLLLRSPFLVFVSTGLVCLGIPIWIFDAVWFQTLSVASIFTHLVAPIIGLNWLRKHNLPALSPYGGPLYYLLLQVMARLITPSEANINVAFRVYEPVAALFSNFYLYSLLNLLLLLLYYTILSRLLKLYRTSP